MSADAELIEELSIVVSDVLENRSPLEAARAASDWPEGFDTGLWSELGQLGYLAVELPEDRGGGGAGFAGLAAVLSAAGARLASLPLVSSLVLGAGILRASGPTSVQDDWLADVASGDRRLAVATSGAVSRRGSLLAGVSPGVLDGEGADGVVVPAAGPDGVELWLVPAGAQGLSTASTPALDQTRRLATVRFEDVHVDTAQRLDAFDEAATLRWAIDRAATALAIDSAAGAQAVLDLTVDYAKDRHQFGRPIGSFQAVKHHCADMLVKVVTSQVAAAAATRELAELPPTASKWPAIAKSHAADAYADVAGLGIFVHGGIGYTWEHPLHLFLKRAKLNQALWGTSQWHREELAALIFG